MNVLWFLTDFCQVSYRCGLLKVGKFEVHCQIVAIFHYGGGV